MLDTVTGEVVSRTLIHEGNEVREFYSQLPHPVVVGIEAIGPMQWFLDLLEELGIECRVGDARKIRAAEPPKQKHDRRDAELILKLLVEKRFPAIWMPSCRSLLPASSTTVFAIRFRRSQFPLARCHASCPAAQSQQRLTPLFPTIEFA
jgi:transposase